MTYHRNPGRLPDDCEAIDPQTGEVTGFRNCHVRLFNGWDSKALGQQPWPSAGGRPPTNWRISKPPHNFEIESYEVAT